MNRVIIDTHTHYSHRRFDSGRDEIITSLPEKGVVAVIEAAIGLDSNETMLSLCKKYPHVYMATGCHPNRTEEMSEDAFEIIKKIAEHPKVLALGETGLDYAGEKQEEYLRLQRKWFERYIELSLSIRKPLIIHCREAYHDMIEILEKYQFPKHPGIIHCFSGTLEQAQELVNFGFLLGIGGKFTHDKELEGVVKEIPVNQIVLETDSPYLLPKELSGKRNSSLNIDYIVTRLAELKGGEKSVIYEAAWRNTLSLFPELVSHREGEK